MSSKASRKQDSIIKEKNQLRIIIRDAMNETKKLTWSTNIEISKEANDIWDRLNSIRFSLGNFES